MNRTPGSDRVRRIAGLGAVAATAVTVVVAGPTGSAGAAPACTDVQIVFARGSTEAAGLGTVGGPFVSSLTGDLSGRTVSSYAVDYAADIAQQSAGAGSTDLTHHVVATAASCPGTKFVLGGYSQGATVVDKSIGITTPVGGGTGTPLPAALAPSIAAIVVFGNPIGIFRQTIETTSTTYGARTKSFCNSGDPVCGGGVNVLAHLQYAINGSTTTGATFAAGRITG